jgi:AcrR family transcriptional regulator
MYRTYASKSDILADACEEAIATVEIFTRQALNRASGPEDALRQVLHAYAQAVLSHTDIIAVAGREFDALPESDRAHLAPRSEDLRDLCAVVVAEVRDDLAREEARLLLDAARTAAQETALLPAARRPQTDTLADLMTNFLLAR